MNRLLIAVLLLGLVAGCGSDPKKDEASYSFAVIGDLPYSDRDLDDMSGWVNDINKADPAFTVHVGDVKTGPADCGDKYFAKIRREFDEFENGLIYTPGDNDWTDCHLKAAGEFDPLERLDALRELMYPKPGTSLGDHPLKMQSYLSDGFPENVTFSRDGVRFAVVHLVGSDNGLLPWKDLGEDKPTAAAKVEQQARTNNAVLVLRDAFRAAGANGDRAVVVLTQANLFRDDVRTDLLRPVVQELIDAADRFNGQVVLVNGDTHEYVEGDHPLEQGSPWLAKYDVNGSADELTQVVTEGDKSADKGWIEFTVDTTKKEPISWELHKYH